MRLLLPSRLALWIATALAGLTAVGCGGVSGPKAHGKVLMNGQPYTLKPGEDLHITFSGVGISSMADVQPDGAFTVLGPTYAGIPPGTYHITVQSTQNGPNATQEQASDKFQGKFTGLAKTPLTLELTSANPEIVIDLGKGTVTTGS